MADAEERDVHTNSESCNIQLWSFNFKQIIQILQSIIIDNFSTHLYVFDISYYFLFFMIRELLLKTFNPVSRIFNNEEWKNENVFHIFQDCPKIQRQPWKQVVS